MYKNLLILSGELIDESMQQYFGQLPSCMIPLHGRPAIDYIYHENRNHYKNIYLLLGKKSEYVKEYLNHSQFNINIIDLPENGSLLFSLQFGLNSIDNDEETTIIFGDTYLPYMSSLFNKKNTVIYSVLDESKIWTVANVVDDKIKFHDKEETIAVKNNNVIIGIFHINNTPLLRKFVDDSISKNDHFYDALKKYLNIDGFKFIETEKWIDYGHVEKYFELKKTVEARSFNEIRVDVEELSLTKTSTATVKFIKEINWLNNLPEALKTNIPDIIDYSVDKKLPYVKMKYYNYLTLHEIFVYGNIPLEKWTDILKNLKLINNSFKEYKYDEENTKGALTEMYLTKTLERLEDFRKQKIIDFTAPITINKIEYESLDKHILNLKHIIDKVGILKNNDFNIIHGDFCLSNILYDTPTDEIKLIDPRGSFGDVQIYGDNFYEWAKLAHSIDGLYDFIISDKFSLVRDKNNINYKIHSQGIQNEIKKIFYSEFIQAENIPQIKLIQSLLFFSMLPLHSNNINRQLVMLSRALELFKQFI